MWPGFAIAAPPEWLPFRDSAQVGCVLNNCGDYHGYWAIDFGAPAGRAVFAAGAGQVTGRGVYNSCLGDSSAAINSPNARGNWIEISHGGGVSTRYLHMSSLSVVMGQQVTQNTQIGTVGNTGASTCTYPHLHYERRVNGVAADPGTLRACHGSSLVSYPNALGYASWAHIPPYQRSVSSNGTVCGIGEGSFVRVPDTGRVYRIAGGAPIYVSHWSAFGGPQHTVGVDQWAFDNLDNPHAHMRRFPADGTFIRSTANGRVYRIAGGAPLYVSHWDAFGGPQHTVGVDQWALDNVDNPHAHLRRVPADGTFLRGSRSLRVFRVAGGAALYVPSCQYLNGCSGMVNVDDWAIDNRDHLLAVPRDGTVLRGLPSGRLVAISQGIRHGWASPAGAVDVDDRMIDAFPVPGETPPAGTSVPLPVSNTPPAAVPSRCRVPRLKGLSLRKAKRRLRRSGCRLGRVVRPTTARRSAGLVVVKQNRRPGKTFEQGKAVRVKLGSARRA
jgi:Peptidase family M23/PASTA domain